MPLEADRLSHLRQAGGFFFPGPRTRIRVTGADRLRYLNGQVSNDLRKLVPGQAMRALVLTVKGKLCADIFVWPENDALLIDADNALAETLPLRLERYAVADDVIFELLPPDRSACHAFGPAAASLDGIRLSRLGVEGVDLVTAPPHLLEATPAEVELLGIERGVPQWDRELTAETLPQEAGLEQTAVDFHKGCYVGQEVVSRIQSAGRVNRHLSGFLGDFDPDKSVSAVLISPSGEKAGWLGRAARHPGLGKTVALGYVLTRCKEASFSVLDESGACLGRAERSEFPLVS